MMWIIVETTHLVISQYAHDATNNGRVHTSTYTTIMSKYAHAFSVKPAVCRSNSAWNEDLVWACRDTKCLSANKHTDQSTLTECLQWLPTPVIHRDYTQLIILARFDHQYLRWHVWPPYDVTYLSVYDISVSDPSPSPSPPSSIVAIWSFIINR